MSNTTQQADRAVLPDLRSELAAAQQWDLELITAVTPDQLSASTPCPELTVRDLIRHLIAGAERVRVMAEGGDATSVPFLADVADGDLVDRYREVINSAQQAWRRHTDLSVPVTAPWGVVPAAAAIGGYLTEAVTHGWDLAVATGQPSEVDADLARTAEIAARKGIPAVRGEGIPFGPVIDSATDATPTERLVNWLGRES